MSTLGISEAARRIGRTPQHVRSLCRDGVLEGRRSGDGRQSWLVTIESIERYLDLHGRPERSDELFSELQLAGERARSAELETEVARLRAELTVTAARVAELEQRLADERIRSAALVVAHGALLDTFRTITPSPHPG